MLKRATVSCSVLLALSTACTGGERAAGSDVAVDSTRGFPEVTVTGESPQWHATHLFTIGTPESGTEFGSVRSVLLDSAGTLVVVDSRNGRVLEFDDKGMLVRQIGRDGAGPREYRDPYSVAWLDGALAVLDPGSPRLAVFGRDGQGWKSWPVQPITGSQIVRLYRTPPTFWSHGSRPVGRTSQRFSVLWDSSGPRDTVVAADEPEDLVRGALCQTPDGGITYFNAPFAGSFYQHPTRDGRRIVVRTDDYRIAWLVAATQDTSRVLVRQVEPSPVTEQDWSSAISGWEKHTSQFGTAGCDRKSFPRRAVKPVVSWFFFDGLGRLWVEVLTSAGTRYDIYDDGGMPVATLTGIEPSGGIDPSATADRIALSGEDASGVPVVRVYRIER